MDLDLEDLRLVAALAQEKSARHAARLLGAHVATVYRRLQALEERVGLQLFERAEGGFQATPAGSELTGAAIDVSHRLGILQRRLAVDRGRLVGDLTVTTTDSLLSVVVEAMQPFQSSYPDLRIRLVMANAMADMARRDADVAIRATASPPETLVGRRVATFDFAVYAAATDLPERWIALDESLSIIPSQRWLTQRGVEIVMHVNSMWAAAAACAAGLGRAVLPSYLARQFKLIEIDVPIVGLESAVWILFHPDHRETPRVRYFVRDVASALQKLL